MSRLALFVIALVALVARVSFEVALHDRAADDAAGRLAGHLLGDERAYDQFARKVADGTLQRERAFYQEPLYAWAVGQVYKLFPPPPSPPEAAVVPHAPVHRAIIAVQHLLGVLMAVLVASLGARCLGPAVGWLAGLFAALSGPAIFAESMLLKESVALTLWVAILHLWLDALQDKGGRTRALLLGALLGLLILLRGNAFLLLGLILLSLALRLGGRRRLPAAGLVLASALLAISPATLHNLRRGDLVLSTYQAGSNAAIGQPDHDSPWPGVTYDPIRAGRGDAAVEEQDAVAVAEAATGSRLTGRQVSAWWWGETLRRVRAHPEAAGQRVGLKLLHTFHGDEVPDVKDWTFFRQALPWFATPLSDLTWLGPLALLGFALLPWRELRDAQGGRPPLRRDLLVVRGSVAVIAASLALFYVMGRYRLPAAPGLWILAAGTLVAGARLLRPPRRARVLVPTLLLAAALVAAGQFPIRPYDRGQLLSWVNLAVVELARARAATNPEDAARHRDAAVQTAQYALRIAPAYPGARSILIHALDLGPPHLQPRTAEALDQAWRLMLLMQGDRTGRNVVDVLQRDLPVVQATALKLRVLPGAPTRELVDSPVLAQVCRDVARNIKQPADLPLALDLMEEAVRRDPHDAENIATRGLVKKRLGRNEEAERDYRAALAMGADTMELHNNLGNLLLAMGRIDEAIASLERALELEPGNPTVLVNLQRARAAR